MKRKLFKLLLVTVLSMSAASCENPQVYGSIGVSSYSGGYGGGGYGSISIGGRIR